MNQLESRNKIPTIFYIAAIIVVLSGVMFASGIITQFLMAIFVAIICSKPVGFLVSKGVPNGASVAITLIGLIFLSGILGGVLGTSVANFTSNIDAYSTRLNSGLSSAIQFLDTLGISTSRDILIKTIDPKTVMNLTAKLLNGFGNLMGNFTMILLIVGFILAENSSFSVKIQAILNKPENGMNQIHTAMTQINQYLGIKTLTSLATGVLIGVALWVIGVDYPLMWALVAFLMNYIPNIGSIIAAIPAMFMAFVNLGFGGVFWVMGVYLFVNVLIGTIIEPKIMGEGLGISTLVVLMSLIFWGYILGTTGMFLSIPLTLAAKIAFESNPNTKWIAIALGTEKDAKESLAKKK